MGSPNKLLDDSDFTMIHVGKCAGATVNEFLSHNNVLVDRIHLKAPDLPVAIMKNGNRLPMELLYVQGGRFNMPIGRYLREEYVEAVRTVVSQRPAVKWRSIVEHVSRADI